MEQFVLIPQQIYEQKFKLNVYKLDKSEEKDNFVLQNLEPFHKDITTKTKIKRKNIEFPDIYNTVFGATGISPNKIVNKDAKSKDRGSWIPFKI